MSLVSTVILVGLLPLLKGILERKIYKERSIDVIEMIIYFNIICFAALTLKMETNKNQVVVAYTSIAITSAFLLAVIVFHVYQYSGLAYTINHFMVIYKEKHHTGCSRLPDDEDNQSLITHSVVEIPRPNLEQRESAIQEVTENTPTTNSHVVMVDVETIATPQLDNEESDPLSPSNIEAAEMDTSYLYLCST